MTYHESKKRVPTHKGIRAVAPEHYKASSKRELATALTVPIAHVKEPWQKPREIELSEIDKEELEFRIAGDSERSPLNNLNYTQMENIGEDIERYFKENNIDIEEIYFTGSRVKGYAKPDSDLDIVVIVKNKDLWKSPEEYTKLNKNILTGTEPLERKHKMKFEILLSKSINDFGYGDEMNTRYEYYRDIKRG